MGRPECIKSKRMKNIKIAMLVLVVFLSSFSFAAAQVENDTKEKVVKTPPSPKKECPSDEACELWEEFKAKYGSNWTVKWHGDRDSPRALYGFYNMGRGVLNSEDGAEQVALEFISSNKKLFKLNIGDLKVKRVMRDNKIGIFNVEYQQYYKGIPVYRGEVGVTLSNKSEIASLGNNFYPGINISTTPKITKEEAVEIAQSELKQALKGETSLYIYPEIGNKLESYLAWKVPLYFSDVFVDASSGEILKIKKTYVAESKGIAGSVGSVLYLLQIIQRNMLKIALLILIVVVLLLYRRRKQ